MAEYSFANRKRDEPSRNQNIGNVVLQVENFDHEKNSATGISADGEVMEIRLATKEEFAELYANRTRYTTQDARERAGATHVRKAPTTGALEQKMQGDELGSVQFQSVKRKDDGELVARWMESLTTTPEDTYVNASVQVKIPRSNEETAGRDDRRQVEMILEDTAAPATMELLDTLTSNKVAGDDGRELEGQLRSTVVVAVQVANDPSETPTKNIWAPWDAEAKEFKQGGQALFEKPLNQKNWEGMVPLAAAVGIPFDDLKFDNSVNATNRTENAPDLYDATMEGKIKVAVAQGFRAEAMPRLRDNLVDAEHASADSDGRKAMMSDRGFFNADVGLRSRPGQEGYGPQTTVKQILPNEFLAPKASDNYAPRTLEAVGERIIAKAEAGGHQLTMSNPADAQPEPRPEPAAEQKQQNAPSMTPSM